MHIKDYLLMVNETLVLVTVIRDPWAPGPPGPPREGVCLRAWEILDMEVSKKHNNDTSFDTYS